MGDFATIALTSVATLLVALVGALVAARLQSEREQRNWLRDKRYEACVTLLKTFDWRDLGEKVDAKRPKYLPAPADLYAELNVLGLDGVAKSAEVASKALSAIESNIDGNPWHDPDAYPRLQAEYDVTREAFVKEVRRALGIKAS